MKKEYYFVNIKCSNCDYGYPYDDDAKILKGTTEEDWSNKTECPRCGCKGTLYFYGRAWDKLYSESQKGEF